MGYLKGLLCRKFYQEITKVYTENTETLCALCCISLCTLWLILIKQKPTSLH